VSWLLAPTISGRKTINVVHIEAVTAGQTWLAPLLHST
jgi:hypothetical protein